MKTNRTAIGILFRTEFRMVLRDRRVLVTAILLPVLVMPLMLAGSHWTLKRREARLNEAVYRYILSGDQADLIRPILRQNSPALTGLPISRPPSNAPSTSQLPTNSGPGARFEEMKSNDPMADLQEGKLEIIIESFSETTNSLLSA